MFWRGVFGRALALGALATTVKGAEIDCPDGFKIIEEQPVEIVYPGPPPSTSTTTLTRTILLPPTQLEDVPYETVTTAWTGTDTRTRTVPPSGTWPGTVIVETPSPRFFVTTTRTGTTDTTITIPPSGTVPGTVIIETPGPGPTPSEDPGTVTTTQTGTAATTLTVPAVGTTPGTVIIVTPGPVPTPSEDPGTVTTTRTGSIATTVTVPAVGTTPGTVIIDIVPSPTPAPGDEPGTVTSTSTGTAETTITVPATGTIPGTVIIVETPEPPISPEPSPEPSSVTITTPWTGFETRTTTASNTVIVETPECSPGLQWAYYKREEGSGPGQIPRHEEADSDTYPFEVFNIETSINGQGPDLTGQTETFGALQNLDEDESLIVYGTNSGAARNWIMVQHLGYFRPNQAGDYTFTVEPQPEGWSLLDDTLFLWFNQEAVSTYDNNNAVMVADAFLPDKGQLEYTFSVSEGDVGSFIPVRFLFLNAQGFMQFELGVRNPDGEVIVSGSVPSVDGQFVNSCTAENAPPLSW